MLNFRRLPLDGLRNARDLGGFSVPNGTTKFRTFIRSDAPTELTENDFELLKNIGLKHVVDFRSENECKANPDVLSQESWVSYTNIPLYDEKAAKGICEEGKSFCWSDHYIRMVDTCTKWILDVMTFFSKTEGCLLFHCATGKDRTGLVSMALLGLCGVSDEDIVADYAVSEIYLKPIFEKYIREGKMSSTDDPFFSTAPENMVNLMNYINDRYGNIPLYLEFCGVSNTIINLLQNRLTQEEIYGT